MNVAKPRIAWVDAAKGLSILLVVFLHAQGFSRAHGLHLEVYSSFNNLLLPIRMPLFFTISGIFAAGAVKKRWSELLKSKVALYYYVFVAWSILRWCYFAFVFENPIYVTEGSAEELLTLWFMPTSGLWFLWVLAIYFPLTKLLGYCSRPVVILALIATSLMILSDPDVVPFWVLQSLSLYALFFVGGAWYGRRAIDWLIRHPALALAGAGAVYVVAGATVQLFENTPAGSVLVPPGRLILSIAGVPLMCAAILFACRVGPFCRVMSYLGRNTLPIYVAHQMILVAITAAVAAAAPLPLVNVWTVPFATALAVIASLGLARILGTFGDRWLYSSAGLKAAFARRPMREQPSLAPDVVVESNRM